MKNYDTLAKELAEVRRKWYSDRYIAKRRLACKILFRVTEEEYKALKIVAEKYGVPISAIIRHYLQPHLTYISVYARWMGWLDGENQDCVSGR